MATESEECCAARCGTSLSDTAKIINVCPSRHVMHAECVLKMYESNDNPACPICRDDTLSLLKDMIIKNPHVESSESDFEVFLPDNSDNSDNSDSSDSSDDMKNHFCHVKNNYGHVTLTVNCTNPQ